MMDFLKISEVLNFLNIREDMLAAEFGCGSADFALTLAKKMPRGKVWALDIQEEKLSVIKSKLAHQKINNVTMLHCDLEALRGSTLPDNSLDLVLIPNLLFQAENKYAIIEEAIRVLKSGGELLIIDWLSGGAFSPKTGLITPEELELMLKKLPVKLQNKFFAGDYHFALVLIKL